MGDGYAERRGKADAHLQQQLELVAVLLCCRVDQIRVAEDAEDWGGVDAYGPDGERVGLRVRATKYRTTGDFAVRLVRDFHGVNELDHLKAGAVDFTLYVFADEGGPIVGWYWLRMNVFAAAAGFDGVRCRIIPAKGFEVFAVDSFTKYGMLVVASKGTG
jgi:hypothetical protein